MDKPVRIGAWIAALAVGVVVGAALFRPGRVEEPPRAARATPPPATDRPATDELARANERITALETQLRALQEKVDGRGKEKEALIQDLRDAFAREPGAVVEDLDEKDAHPFGWRVTNRPQTVAGLLGLDAARRKSLEDTYKSFVDRIRRLEKEHAKTTVDGDTTRIEIPPFPAQGKALIEEWKAQLGTILTPDEAEKYRKMQLGLLPADVGQHERMIAIATEKDGTVSSTEHSANGGSSSYKGPREGALAPYNHLLMR